MPMRRAPVRVIEPDLKCWPMVRKKCGALLDAGGLAVILEIVNPFPSARVLDRILAVFCDRFQYNAGLVVDRVGADAAIPLRVLPWYANRKMRYRWSLHA